MARYTGPKDKISRRHGIAIFGPSKALDRRPYSPGQHGGAKNSPITPSLSLKSKSSATNPECWKNNSAKLSPKPSVARE